MPTVRTHSPEGWQRRQLRGKVCSFPRSSPSPLELIGKRKSQGEGGRVGRAPDGTGTRGPPLSLKRRGPRGPGRERSRSRSRRGAASGASAARGPRGAPRLFYSPSDIMSCPAAIGCAAPGPPACARGRAVSPRCPRAVPAAPGIASAAASRSLRGLGSGPAPRGARRLSPGDRRHKRLWGTTPPAREKEAFKSFFHDTPNIHDQLNAPNKSRYEKYSLLEYNNLSHSSLWSRPQTKASCISHFQVDCKKTRPGRSLNLRKSFRNSPGKTKNAQGDCS